MLKLRDWACDHCDTVEEILKEESDGVPFCKLCDRPMRMTIAVMRRWNVDVDKLKEYKRREAKGKRVRAMIARDLK